MPGISIFLTVWENQGWHIKRLIFWTLWSCQMCGWSCLKDLLTWGEQRTSLPPRNVLSIFNTIRSASCCLRKRSQANMLGFYGKFSSHAKSVSTNQKNIINASMAFTLHLWTGHIICILFLQNIFIHDPCPQKQQQQHQQLLDIFPGYFIC